MNLSGKAALVTGGSKGIGRAIAAELIGRGARVAITARTEGELRKTAEELGALAIAGDACDEGDCTRAVESVTREFGRLDVLVNNAGTALFEPLLEAHVEQLDAMLAANVRGPFLMAQAAARHMVERGEGGAIINISSMAGVRGFAGASAYCASKYALRGLTESWRAELRKYNIRVMVINPSTVNTGMAERLGLNPTERTTTPEDIALLVRTMLEMEDRSMVTEVNVISTNP